MAARVEYLDEKDRFAERMYSELVAELAMKYDLREWLRRCRAQELHPDLQVEFEEWAGIMEFDGGLSREQAEVKAAEIVFNNHNVL